MTVSVIAVVELALGSVVQRHTHTQREKEKERERGGERTILKALPSFPRGRARGRARDRDRERKAKRERGSARDGDIGRGEVRVRVRRSSSNFGVTCADAYHRRTKRAPQLGGVSTPVELDQQLRAARVPYC